MNRVSHVCLVVGGVLARRVADITLDVFEAGRSTPADKRLRLDELESWLALGRLTAREYCLRAAELLCSPRSAEEIDRAMTAGGAIAPEMGAIADALASRCCVTLISDYPQTWLKRLLEMHPCGGHISRVGYFSEAGAPDLGASSVHEMVRLGWLIQGESYLVDWNPTRVSAAIRCDLSAQIFVDSGRCRRELEMIGLLTPQSAGLSPD